MVALGLTSAVLLIAQAWAVTGVVVTAVGGSLLGVPLGGWSAAAVGVLAARALTSWLGDVLSARAAAKVGAGIRRRVLGSVLSGDPGASATSSGEVAALATRGVAAAEPYLTRYVPALVLAGVLPVLTVVAIGLVDWLSALIVVLTLPLVPVFGVLVGLATRERAESQWRALASLSGHFVDVVRGLPTLVAFRRARAQSAVIASVTDTYRRRTLATLRIAFASSAVLELVATLSVALVAVTVGLRLATGGLSLSSALVVLLLAPEAYWPLRRVGAEFHAAAEGAATFEAAAALAPPAGPGALAGRAGSVRLSGAAFRLRQASVSYPGRTAPALAPASLDLAGPGITAVVGRSGCGKSTLLGLLAGRLEPSSGTVVGPPAEEIAVLPQRPVFLAGSIADNLRLAAPDATDGEIWAALAEVALAERVRALPAGLDTGLGEDGLTLSAGERARLALARVVLCDRPWVLLDEPTAHLDDHTESVVAETVAALGRSRGVVLVAHRPALVDLADRVVELSAPTAQAPDAPADSTARAATPATVEPGDPTAVGATEPPARRSGAPDPAGGGRLVDHVVGGLASTSGVALTATAGWLIVQASTHPPVLTLLVAVVAVRAFGLARPVLRYWERLRSHDRALRLLAERRVRVYDSLVPLTPGRLGRRRGDLLASVVDDVDAVLDRELRVRQPLGEYAVVGTLSATIAAFVDPVAGAIVAGVCALGGGAAYLLARRAADRSEAAAVTARARLAERVLETLQTAEELRGWQAEDRALVRVEAAAAAVSRSARTTAARLGGARAWTLLVAGAGIAATALLVDGVGGPMLALLLLTPLALAEPLAGLADAGAVAARTRRAEDRLAALERTEPAVADPATPAAAPERADLAVDGVTARWGDREVLAGLDLRIPAGDTVAVVGPSGCGKSTLAALLVRFLDPASGSVALGGTDVRALALDDVRARVGLVDDDPHVFASTVVENVRFARPGASDAEVEQALRRAHLGEWLDALPEGLHTRLGDGGAQISGGERARLAVARSVLADQRVLVLDEPTAHLDTDTAEQLAAEVLRSDGRTVVWITHAATGLDRVDRVVDLAPDRARPQPVTSPST